MKPRIYSCSIRTRKRVTRVRRPGWLLALPLVAVLWGALPAERAGAQTSPETTVITRINSLDFVNRQAIPYLWQRHAPAIDVPYIGIGTGSSYRGPGYQEANIGVHAERVRVRTNLGLTTVDADYQINAWMENLTIKLPVSDQSVRVAFADAPADSGKIGVGLALPQAELRVTLKLRAITTTAAAPDFRDDLSIRITGLTGDLRATLAKTASAGVQIQRMDSAAFRVGSVRVNDSGWLSELARTGLSLAHLFGFRGPSTLDGYCTQAVNNMLASKGPQIAEGFRDAINRALSAQTTVEGQVSGGSAPGSPDVRTRVSLQGIGTTGANCTAHFDVQVTTTGGSNIPGVTFTHQSRPGGGVLQSPQGDLEVNVPLGLVDKCAFEAARLGALPGSFSGTHSGIAYTATATLNGPIRAAAATRGGGIKLTVPIGILMQGQRTAGVHDSGPPLASQRVGLWPRLGLGLVGPDRIEIPSLEGLHGRLQSNNVEGTIEVLMGIEVSAQERLLLNLRSANVHNLTGTVSVGMTEVPISMFQGAINQGLSAHIRDHFSSMVVLQKLSKFTAPLDARLGNITVGSYYIRIPLTLQMAP
ncbi:MAG: hypothetical protein HY321_22685 [Armatimonadetes bacterium]|nr:hypothetical protein [Armatimonadota bacterium]